MLKLLQVSKPSIECLTPACSAGESRGVASDMSPAQMAKVAENTEGFSAADMSDMISDACQIRVREAISQASQTGALPDTLRPVTFTDFKVTAQFALCAAVNLLCIASVLNFVGCKFLLLYNLSSHLHNFQGDC